MVRLGVTNTPAQNLAYSNRAYVSADVFSQLSVAAVRAGITVAAGADPWVNCYVANLVFQISGNKGIDKNDMIGLNGKQRKLLNCTLGQEIEVIPYVAAAGSSVESFEISIDQLVKKEGAPAITIDCDALAIAFKQTYGNQVYTQGQDLAMEFTSFKLDLKIVKINFVDLAALTGVKVAHAPSNLGVFSNATELIWKKSPDSKSPIILTGKGSGPTRNDNLFKQEFDFEKMGIGGLGAQFQTIFRKAFASRIFPGLLKEMGMSHVRGMLLFGPPGCGKTLIARQIGKVLNAREPKIVNGPEILDKFVGGSEEKVRALFAEAEKEQIEMGDNSMLHIIIFDEMDAIMKKRGSTSDSTGVNDSVVNQLLSKIDGVDALNNILIIGMTNRKDMIDEAIMRPGRLEIQIEIGLPDLNGRLQILNIHTASMKKFNRISADALSHLEDIAEATKNYTGAELEGLVRAASSFAFTRNIDGKDLKKFDEKAVIVQYDDFQKAILETVPAFGNKDAAEISSYCRNDVIRWGPRFNEFWATLQKLMKQATTSKWAHLMSVMIKGDNSTGKTAIAAKLCMESKYPFIRMISADAMIGMSESAKCSHIFKIFSDSYKSPLSMIFIDDIERIIEFSPVGPRFSNTVLQTLLVLLRKVPPSEASRLLIVVTTSQHNSLEQLVNQLDDCFTLSLQCPLMESVDEVAHFLQETTGLSGSDCMEVAGMCPKPIGVKRLLVALELAREDSESESTAFNVNKEELITILNDKI